MAQSFYTHVEYNDIVTTNYYHLVCTMSTQESVKSKFGHAYFLSQGMPKHLRI